MPRHGALVMLISDSEAVRIRYEAARAVMVEMAQEELELE